MTPSDNDRIRKIQMVTLIKASEILSISKRTLQRLIASGKFPRPIKVGATTRVLLSDLEGYIQHQRNQGELR